jgi:hypothetical protein
MGTVKVIEDLTDPDLTLERAWIAEESGYLVPRALVGGRVCNIDTRTGPLADGIAFCEPIDGEPWNDWPMDIIVKKEEDSLPERMYSCTTNPRIVAAARRFKELITTGEAREGMEL